VPTKTKTTSYQIQDNDVIVGERASSYVLRVRDLPDQKKPREKLLTYGPSGLALSEIVAVLFGVGTRKEEVLRMSQRIIKEYGERAILHETNPRRLADALDIPLAKACQLVAGIEIGRRFFATKAGRPIFLRTEAQAYEYLRSMAGLQKEQLRGLYVNSRFELVHEEVISVGSLTANIIHPREVFQPAIEYGAVGVIVAHNHPSGNPKPTPADISITRQLKSAGDILGIDVLDHIIITEKTHTSAMEDMHE